MGELTKDQVKMVKSILLKLGIEAAVVGKLGNARALRKLSGRLAKQGVPDDLSGPEIEFVRGLDLPGDPGKPAKAAGLGQDSEQGEVGDPDRGEAEEHATVDPSVPKSKKNNKTKPVFKKDKATKAVKPVNKAVPKAPRVSREPHAGNASAIFRAFFPRVGSKAVKSAVKDDLIKAGVTPNVAGNYIVYAKRGKPGPPGQCGNPWGFRLEETKDDDGVKIVSRIK